MLAIGRSSIRGIPSAPSTTAVSTRSPTTGARPSTSCTMVFGNLGDDSGTGVAFTRDPNTGENELFGEYLVNAQGEDVVAGIRTPEPIADLEQNAAGRLRAVHRRSRTSSKRHYRDMQDLEFTVERGKLYMLQTRSGKRSAEAAVQDRARHGARGLDRSGAKRCAASTPPRSISSFTRASIRRQTYEVAAQGPQRLAGRGDGRSRLRSRDGGRAWRPRAKP